MEDAVEDAVQSRNANGTGKRPSSVYDRKMGIVMLFLWHYQRKNTKIFEIFGKLPCELMLALVDRCYTEEANTMRMEYQREFLEDTAVFRQKFEQFVIVCHTVCHLSFYRTIHTHYEDLITRIDKKIINIPATLNDGELIPAKLSLCPCNDEEWNTLEARFVLLQTLNVRTTSDVYKWVVMVTKPPVVPTTSTPVDFPINPMPQPSLPATPHVVVQQPAQAFPILPQLPVTFPALQPQLALAFGTLSPQELAAFISPEMTIGIVDAMLDHHRAAVATLTEIRNILPR